MPVQDIRRRNLAVIVSLLEHNGLTGRDEQAKALGGAVTGFRLQSMLDGAHIESFFAGSAEHALRQPRGWMSRSHETLPMDLLEPTNGHHTSSDDGLPSP